MKRSRILTFLICVAVFGAPIGWLAKDIASRPKPVAVVVDPVTPTAESDVRGVTVGELITLEVEGDDVEWAVAPPCDDKAAEGDSENRLYISFRSSGLHSVYAATSLGGKAAIHRFDFKAGDGAVPNPSPEPGPEPGPDLPPEPVEDPFVKRVRNWEPGPNTGAVADAFSDAADWTQSRLDDSKLVTSQQILAKTTKNVSRAVGDKTQWRTFFGNLEEYLAAEAEDNSLMTQRDYIRTWRKIAEALESL